MRFKLTIKVQSKKDAGKKYNEISKTDNRWLFLLNIKYYYENN